MEGDGEDGEDGDGAGKGVPEKGDGGTRDVSTGAGVPLELGMGYTG